MLFDLQLQQVLLKPKVLGHLAKWAIELGEHDIEYHHRKTIKGQTLIDFWPRGHHPHHRLRAQLRCQPWNHPSRLHKYFSSEESGVGVVIISPEGHLHPLPQLPCHGQQIWVRDPHHWTHLSNLLQAYKVYTFFDSQIVVTHMLNTYQEKDKYMRKYLSWV